MPNKTLKDVKKVNCSNCGKRFFRTTSRRNESRKFRWKSYCSLICLSEHRSKGKGLVCAREDCEKAFYRRACDLKKTKHSYCSASCAAIVNNHRYPKRHALIKYCEVCNNPLRYGIRFCSLECKTLIMYNSREKIIVLIQDFYKDNDRIPLKREFSRYRATRRLFGTWNNAIIAAGFDPNPVRFAKKFIANDGHKCDSLAERIIDDWLSRRNIKHKINCPYPGNKKYTADFVVGNIWIEFFGLSGKLRRYDELKRKKLKLIKRYNINLIELYPKDLFPKGKLNEILEPVVVNAQNNYCI